MGRLPGGRAAVRGQRPRNRNPEIFVYRANARRSSVNPPSILADDIEWPWDRKGGHWKTACQRLDIDEAERVRAARKDEDISGRIGRGELRAVLRAEKQDLGIGGPHSV